MFRGERQVRVVADDKRILAAELEADLREHATLAHRLLNQFACGRRSGEADHADAFVAHERHADFRAETLDGRIQASRQAGFLQQLPKRNGRVGRQLV